MILLAVYPSAAFSQVVRQLPVTPPSNVSITNSVQIYPLNSAVMELFKSDPDAVAKEVVKAVEAVAMERFRIATHQHMNNNAIFTAMQAPADEVAKYLNKHSKNLLWDAEAVLSISRWKTSGNQSPFEIHLAEKNKSYESEFGKLALIDPSTEFPVRFHDSKDVSITSTTRAGRALGLVRAMGEVKQQRIKEGIPAEQAARISIATLAETVHLPEAEILEIVVDPIFQQTLRGTNRNQRDCSNSPLTVEFAQTITPRVPHHPDLRTDEGKVEFLYLVERAADQKGSASVKNNVIEVSLNDIMPSLELGRMSAASASDLSRQVPEANLLKKLEGVNFCRIAEGKPLIWFTSLSGRTYPPLMLNAVIETARSILYEKKRSSGATGQTEVTAQEIAAMGNWRFDDVVSNMGQSFQAHLAAYEVAAAFRDFVSGGGQFHETSGEERERFLESGLLEKFVKRTRVEIAEIIHSPLFLKEAGRVEMWISDPKKLEAFRAKITEAHAIFSKASETTAVEKISSKKEEAVSRKADFSVGTSVKNGLGAVVGQAASGVFYGNGPLGDRIEKVFTKENLERIGAVSVFGSAGNHLASGIPERFIKTRYAARHGLSMAAAMWLTDFYFAFLKHGWDRAWQEYGTADALLHTAGVTAAFSVARLPVTAWNGLRHLQKTGEAIEGLGTVDKIWRVLRAGELEAGMPGWATYFVQEAFIFILAEGMTKVVLPTQDRAKARNAVYDAAGKAQDALLSRGPADLSAALDDLWKAVQEYELQVILREHSLYEAERSDLRMKKVEASILAATVLDDWWGQETIRRKITPVLFPDMGLMPLDREREVMKMSVPLFREKGYRTAEQIFEATQAELEEMDEETFFGGSPLYLKHAGCEAEAMEDSDRKYGPSNGLEVPFPKTQYEARLFHQRILENLRRNAHNLAASFPESVKDEGLIAQHGEKLRELRQAQMAACRTVSRDYAAEMEKISPLHPSVYTRSPRTWGLGAPNGS